MKIIKFKNKYRDDLIFMILEAKNALGRVPGLNDRVIGSVGFNSNGTDATLHRLFVKYNLKHQGIGTALLNQAETYIKSQGKETIYVNLGQEDEWFESRNFYTKHGYVEYEPNRMRKDI